MLYHDKCSGPVLLDITEHTFFVVSFGMLKTGLKVSNGDIIIKDNKFPSRFYCQECKETTDVNGLFAFCMNCGHRFSMHDLFKPSHSNGIYCRLCVNQFDQDGEVSIPLINIVKTTLFKA